MIYNNDLNILNSGEKNHITDCLTRQLFNNKKVLEVGGITPYDITQKLGARSWTCVDPSRASDNINFPEYRQFKQYIADFNNDDGFDMIYSTNCFEHISNLEESLEQMYKLLRPGGYLSALMGPIYSCYKGHHIWLQTEKYGLINFNNIKLDDWGHLIFSDSEMYDNLSKNYDEETTVKIINFIKKGKSENKMFFDDYADIINRSKFKIIEFRDWHTSKYPGTETSKRLEKYNKKNFSTVSIKIILEK